MSNTLCVLPWMHLSVDGMGHFYNCCFGPSGANQSRDEKGNIIVAGEKDSIKRHWYSSTMKEVRQSMMNGEKHFSCKACWRIEDTGSESFRHVAARDYPVNPSLLTTTEPPPNFRYVDLRFGNLCNLACRMCVPYNTRKLFKEFEEMYGKEMVDPYRKMDWYQNADFWNELYEYRGNIEKIHMAGGEPLLIKECWNFLRELSKDPRAKDIYLSYNTNLTKIPPEAKELWPKFKGVFLIVSMDGVGKVNEFIRYPQKWDEFESNLWEIDNHWKEYNIHVCQIQPTIQAFNIKRVVELCEYTNRFKNIFRTPLMNLLFEPHHFHPSVLPKAYREEAVKDIEDYIKKLEGGHNNHQKWQHDQLLTALHGIVTYIRGEDKPELFHEFMRHNDIYDINRNQKILEFIPELEVAYRK